MLKWTDKQREYLQKATHRWNFKIGAVRSGKTFQDKEDIIARRIRQRKGLDGLVVLIGVTEATIERNVLRPMRDKFGSELVGNISKNKVWLFGEECYALGAEKITQVSKIQGASFKYVYGDEVAKWKKEVFDMVKSRLDQDYSLFDGTCNPEQKNHWLKEFLDSDADIYIQHYTIDDNTFLSKTFIENLKKEYKGTVLYNRYILGLWCNAEGLIYRTFADNPKKYIWTKKKKDNNGNETEKYDLPPGYTIIGIDYGGTKSGQAFVATRISYDFTKVIALATERHFGDIDPDKLEELELNFILKVMYKYDLTVDDIFPDNEETVLIRGLRNACERKGIYATVRGSKKVPVNNRIDCERTIIAYGIFYYIKEECETLVEALESALWSDKPGKDNKDERLDDFTTDIDSLDAFEYTFERYIPQITDVVEMRRKNNV